MGLQPEQMQAQTSPTRIDWRRLGIRLLVTLILPVSAAWWLDQLLATSPFVMMVVAIICIPLATFVVMRTALDELDRVIREVAPPQQESEVAELVNAEIVNAEAISMETSSTESRRAQIDSVEQTKPIDSVAIDIAIDSAVKRFDDGNGAPDATN